MSTNKNDFNLDDINFDDFGFDADSLEDLKTLGITKEDLQKAMSEGDDPNYNQGYKVGYNVGYVDGFDQGQSTLMLEKENDIYNLALDDAISEINKFTFPHKDNLLQILNVLRRGDVPPALDDIVDTQ